MRGQWYRWEGPDLLLRLRLLPGSRMDAFADVQQERLRVRITTPPVDGRANTHLVAWLAKQFGVAGSAVSIEAGHNGRLKRVRIREPARLPDAVRRAARP